MNDLSVIRTILITILFSLLLPDTLESQVSQFQLNENCTVNILGRTSQVADDGTWIIPNITQIRYIDWK